VVLPKPAGAAMSVSLRCNPSFIRSVRRGRRTTFGRSGGMYSFVANSGVDTDELLDYCALATRDHHQRVTSRNTSTRSLAGVFRGGVPRDADNLTDFANAVLGSRLSATAAFRFFSSTPFGRPPLRPRARAAVSPAGVRSESDRAQTRRATQTDERSAWHPRLWYRAAPAGSESRRCAPLGLRPLRQMGE